jgi:hypothetical protein
MALKTRNLPAHQRSKHKAGKEATGCWSFPEYLSDIAAIEQHALV